MAYIGLPPKANFTSGLLDRFTSTTGTTVTLTHDISSENDIVVFVNFVKQDSTTYSVGGTGNKTLTLGGTLVSSDIVEVHYLNIVGQTVAPSSGSVGSSQLTADVITGQTALAVAPDSTDELLISDGGTLKRIDVSLVGGANTPIFRATVNGTQSVPNATYTKIEFDTEVFDPQSTFDVQNYRFTPAVAGYYFICAKIRTASDNDFGYFGCNIYKNGSDISSANNSHFHFDSVSTSIIDLADDNDYYEVFTYHNEGGGMNYTNSTQNMQFFAYKLI